MQLLLVSNFSSTFQLKIISFVLLLAGVCLLLLLLLFVISTSISISNIVNFVMFVRLPWIAPECYGNLSNMTPESDIYAFGITLWEIFSLGKRPYDWLDPKQVIYSVVRQTTFD